MLSVYVMSAPLRPRSGRERDACPRAHPRHREYPHPPPPSTNNSTTIINRVVIFHLVSIQDSAVWEPNWNVREHTVETRSSRQWFRASPVGKKSNRPADLPPQSTHSAWDHTSGHTPRASLLRSFVLIHPDPEI